MTGHRATQLRASFVQPAGRLRVVWWITDTALPLTELADDATPELVDALVEERLQAVGPVTWQRLDDAEPTLVANLRTCALIAPEEVTR